MRDIKNYDEFMEELQSLFVWDFVEGMLNFNVEEAQKEISELSEEEKKGLIILRYVFTQHKMEEYWRLTKRH